MQGEEEEKEKKKRRKSVQEQVQENEKVRKRGKFQKLLFQEKLFHFFVGCCPGSHDKFK